MSFNPHLNDPGEGSSWETISNSSNDSGYGSGSEVFFGGNKHIFTTFKQDLSELLDKNATSSGSGPIKGAKQVSSSFQKLESFLETPEDFNPQAHYDPSILVGKGVTLDAGLRKAGDPKESLTRKIAKFVANILTPSKRPFSESDLSGSGKGSKLKSKNNANSSVKVKGSSSNGSTSSSKLGGKNKNPSISALVQSFKKMFTSNKNAKASPADFFSKQSSTPSFTHVNNISSPISTSSVGTAQLEDQIKGILSKVEQLGGSSTYNWMGATVLTKGLEEISKIFESEGKSGSGVSSMIEKLQNQWDNTPFTPASIRSVSCALLDMTTNSDNRGFAEVLEENEGSDDLVNMAQKAENILTPGQMKILLSHIAKNLSLATASAAKTMVQQGNVDVSIGTSGVKSCLDKLNQLRDMGIQNWSNTLQVITNEIFQ